MKNPGTNYYIDAGEIAEIMGCGRKKAYQILADLTAELQAEGIIMVRGLLPREYFMARVGLGADMIAKIAAKYGKHKAR